LGSMAGPALKLYAWVILRSKLFLLKKKRSGVPS